MTKARLDHWGLTVNKQRDGRIENHRLMDGENKMKPTNPNAHTHDTDTDVQTQFAKHRFPLQ